MVCALSTLISIVSSPTELLPPKSHSPPTSLAPLLVLNVLSASFFGSICLEPPLEFSTRLTSLVFSGLCSDVAFLMKPALTILFPIVTLLHLLFSC